MDNFWKVINLGKGRLFGTQEYIELVCDAKDVFYTLSVFKFVQYYFSRIPWCANSSTAQNIVRAKRSNFLMQAQNLVQDDCFCKLYLYYTIVCVLQTYFISVIYRNISVEKAVTKMLSCISTYLQFRIISEISIELGFALQEWTGKLFYFKKIWNFNGSNWW